VLTDGKIMCWGDNTYGKLGDGSVATERTSPVQVSGYGWSITTASSIALGSGHSCALLTDGTVKCWGRNGWGGLGDGTTTNRNTPVEVSGITTATSIALGSSHSCAVLTDGTVKCWGRNGWGGLGDGTTDDSSTPVEVSGITTATSIALGGSHSCAVLTDGTVKCWGLNLLGQLGDGTFQCVRCSGSGTPVEVSGITTATSIALGYEHSCALLTDGTVKCWGSNGSGQLGDGTTTKRNTPVEVSGISTATSIALGSGHSCALLMNSTVMCWGYNGSGQLGDGSVTDRNTPVEVPGLILEFPPPPPTTTTTTSPPPPPLTTNSTEYTPKTNASLVTHSGQSSEQNSPSLTGAIVGSVVGFVILFPGTTFTILTIWCKPYLRKKLLQNGCRRTADIFVPDIKSDLKSVSERVSELEAKNEV
jgi:alpha-tubulin suppressor-like RCC1 family protein